MRKKLPDNKKKPKISITIDKKLVKILNNYLEKTGTNRSKYIEDLVRKDFEEKGFDVKPDFDI
jgi:metal-responsive CopG/Arc/MetJ family transcriptional regulator